MSMSKLPGRVTLGVHLLIATVFWTTVTVVGCSTNGDNTSTPDASDDGTTTIFDSGTTDTGGDSTTTNCSGSQTACGGSCVNTTNDPKNCGSCGATCGGGLVCSSGKCAVGCATGQTLCGAGTCANLQTDFD
ncbi:MAG TPA: hypothetical protein VIF15_07990, partial [Polyangiaceae bacterium]